jgi:hypothetical protein
MLKIAAKPGDVTLLRGAEKLFVLVAKGQWVFIAHTEPGARYVQVFTEHHTARFLEPDLFMKLQRAYRRDGLEVMIEAGNAHSEFARDILHSERLVEMFAEIFDRL